MLIKAILDLVVSGKLQSMVTAIYYGILLAHFEERDNFY